MVRLPHTWTSIDTLSSIKLVLFHFLSSSLICFLLLLCSKIPSRTPHYIYSTCLLKSLGFDSFFDFPCVLQLLRFWEVLVKCFVKHPSNEIYLMFSHDKTGDMCFWEENHRGQEGEVPFINLRQGYILSMQFMTMLTLISWMRFDRFFHCKVSFFNPPFHAVLIGRRLLCASHT